MEQYSPLVVCTHGGNISILFFVVLEILHSITAANRQNLRRAEPNITTG